MTQPTIPPPKSSRPDPRPPRASSAEESAPSGASFHDLLAEEKEVKGLTPEEQVATPEVQPEDPEEPQGSDDGEAGGDERVDDTAADESDEPEQIDEDDPSEAIEEPEEPTAEDDKDPVEDQGEVAELRRELNELRQQHAETLAFLRQQVHQPEPTAAAPENPEVEEAFELYADPTLSQKERDEALKAYSPAVRRKAEAKVREAIEERRLLDRDPDRWVDKRVGPRLRELEQKFEEAQRSLAVEAFKARNADLYASPEAKARLLAVMEQGAKTGKVDPDQAALVVRQEIQVAKAKKAATKVDARARDARARKAAARQQAGRRAEPRSGGEARGGATGTERTFRELLKNEEGRVV